MWPRRPNPEPDDAPQPPRDVADIRPGAEPRTIPDPLPVPPTRPGLARNALQPPPGLLAGRGKQLEQVPSGTDSLSLQQLRRVVADIHRIEPVAYDFEYTDVGPHAEEIDEWFVYQFWQWVRLNAVQKAFEWHWSQEVGDDPAWEDADEETRARFVGSAIAGVQSNDAALRSASIGKLVYLVLGKWADTAMPADSDNVVSSRCIATPPQLRAIKEGVILLNSLGGLPVVWEALRNCFEMHWSGDVLHQASQQEAQDELMNLMTIVYITIQQALQDSEGDGSLELSLLELDPPLVNFLAKATWKLRWDEHVFMPHTQAILLVFGTSNDLKRLKKAISESSDHDANDQVITASPLDYHVFRQEITSKYPAYVPPPPVLPLEADSASLLPSVSNPSARAPSSIIPHAALGESGGASILHQPVHIATPAPSPPPSPGVGGKGAKKQNFQTNQNFPFMYPPLDASSNSAGGKGLAGTHAGHDARRLEGSDVPVSILEAGELFSSRVRMTRAMRHLWEERERFLQHERGFGDPIGPQHDSGSDDGFQGLYIDDLSEEDQKILRDMMAEDGKKQSPAPSDAAPDFGPHPELLEDRDKKRLYAVESFYGEVIPQLQSLVIVLLRPILANVTAIVAQQAAQQAAQQNTQQGNQTAPQHVTQQSPQPPPVAAGKGSAASAGDEVATHNPPETARPATQTREVEWSNEEIESARTREITAKAITGILFLLSKWLKLSHVLKFEYFAQLLLDSNYFPLVLKLFAHQDIQQVVERKIDRVENSFFQFCNMRSKFIEDKVDNDTEDSVEKPEEGSKQEQAEPLLGTDEESDDSAAPPPIRRQRSPQQPETGIDRHDKEQPHAPANAEDNQGTSNEESSDRAQPAERPEVDELGYAIHPLPTKPITDFSRRNFFSLVNYLRVMQKLCKGKAHRNLMLVQYKSTILRKSLRVPQRELRLYTLKLFKNQVPYCGRKWRQSNMRVITAIYLHCKPELRDVWLAGSDVDADVESALPQEQALRSLTHFHNVRRYPAHVPAQIWAAHRQEHDFFRPELEKMGLEWSSAGPPESGE